MSRPTWQPYHVTDAGWRMLGADVVGEAGLSAPFWAPELSSLLPVATRFQNGGRTLPRMGLQLQLEERLLMEEATGSSPTQLPGVRSSVGSQHEYSVCMSHRDNFRDQVHQRCIGRWERGKRGEGEPIHEQTRFLHSSQKHLPFTSTQINPSRTGSAKREKLAFERLAGSANWSQT